jgi:hypothetical protein
MRRGRLEVLTTRRSEVAQRDATGLGSTVQRVRVSTMWLPRICTRYSSRGGGVRCEQEGCGRLVLLEVVPGRAELDAARDVCREA